MNCLKIFIGQAWLAGPFVFSRAGYLGGCFLFGIVALVNGYTMMLNLKLAEKNPLCHSYSEIARKLVGPYGKVIVDINLCAQSFAFCSGYLYFIANQMEAIICHYTNGRDVDGNLTGFGYCDRIDTYIILVTIPALPISWIETYTLLSYFSGIGTIAGFSSIAMMIGYMMKILQKGGISAAGEMKVFDLKEVIANFGIAVFLFEGNAVVTNIRSETKNKHLFRRIVTISICLMLTVTIIFCFFGYYVYGKECKSIFTLALYPINGLVFFVLLCLSVNMFMCYPVQILAAFDIIE